MDLQPEGHGVASGSGLKQGKINAAEAGIEESGRKRKAEDEDEAAVGPNAGPIRQNKERKEEEWACASKFDRRSHHHREVDRDVQDVQYQRKGDFIG